MEQENPNKASIRRRDLVCMLAGGAMASSLPAQAQGMPVIGYINAGAAADAEDLLAAFKAGLREAQFIDGQNVATDYQWADDHYDRLPALAADIVARRVAVIASTSTPVALAAKAATTTIPVAFTVGGDPVKLGLVASLARPGGNLTGVTRYNVELVPKRLELLHDVVPRASSIGLLVNPNNPNTATLSKAVREAANPLGVVIQFANAGGDDEVEAAFADLRRSGVDAVAIANDPFFNSRSEKLAEQTLRYVIPSIYQYRKFVEAGGLMSYGASNTDSHRQLGVYVGRILTGAKPADLPVERSTKLDLLINLKTARTLGLTVPQLLLAQAGELIE